MRKSNIYLAMLALFLPLLSKTYAQECSESIFPSKNTSSFIIFNDGTAADTSTNLTWQRCYAGQQWNGSTCVGEPADMSWNEALEYVNDFNNANSTNWRLPNIKELASIVEKSCHWPSINKTIFPSIGELVWSSTVQSGTSGVFVLSFSHGSIESVAKGLSISVRLVKTPPQ